MIDTEDIDTLKAGNEIDAFIAEKIMGLEVVALDWPCGYQPDNCDIEAATRLEYAKETPDWYNYPRPVYKPSYGTWPAEPDTYHGEPSSYVWVNPVPFYSVDKTDAFSVVEKLMECGWDGEILTHAHPDEDHDKYVCLFDNSSSSVTVYAGADTLALAICRAAVKLASWYDVKQPPD